MITPDTTKTLVDQRLGIEFDRVLSEADRVGTPFRQLVEVIRDTTIEEGKRLRPYMSMLMYEAYSGLDGADIIDAAAAQELLHVAMLIHDDVMDHDIRRHGKLNITGRYLEIYEPFISGTKLRHEADAMAILAGDLLEARAYRLANLIETKPEIKRRIEDVISMTITRVIGGQLLDTQATFRSDVTIDPLAVAEHKTAAYTFEMPLTIGALLGEAPETELELLVELGRQVGIGYQFMDDLLGSFGDESKTGKSADGDIREGKRTTLIQAFDDRASAADKTAFYRTFGNSKATSADIAAARKILESSGARQAVEKQLARIGRQAGNIVARLAIPAQYKTALLSLAERGLSRAK